MASLVIHAKCEDVSRALMSHLGLQIPEFKLKRRLTIDCSAEKDGSTMLSVIGKDIDGLPFSYFKEVKYKYYNVIINFYSPMYVRTCTRLR